MAFDVKAFFDPATSTATYLVWDAATGEAAVIDPVLDYEPRAAKISTASADAILAAMADRRLTLTWILETHAHADHLSAADHLRRATGAKVAIGEKITEVQDRFRTVFGAQDVVPDGRAFDRLVADGDELMLGATSIKVMHTPGHTPACVTYLIGDAAFVGDTLFMPDYGTARADFPGGDAAALYRSIRRILSLPPQTRIFVGHDYLPEGRDRPAWETTVAAERARNVHIHDGVSESEFVTFRNARDATLAPPMLILPSLQVNIRAGALPPPEADGRVYLKLPVVADASDRPAP
jgi:glyoxylase-like metal-dependent hydrolase (beta-lactamase superfamily II)